MSRICPDNRLLSGHATAPVAATAGTFSASSASAGLSGTRSTGSPTAARRRRRSGPRGRSAAVPAGYHTKRLADDRLRETLDQARRGTCRAPSEPAHASTTPPRSGSLRRALPRRQTLDAAPLPLDRQCPPPPRFRRPAHRGHHHRPGRGMASGPGWSERQADRQPHPQQRRRRRPRHPRALAKVFGLRFNPAADIQPPRERYDATRFTFYSPEQVTALSAPPRRSKIPRSISPRH